MKILIACEFSGIVREAFRKKGHDAWSCDVLDSDHPGPHIKGDVLSVLDHGWDMMIAHPPCTWLCAAQRSNAARKDRPKITEVFFEEREKAFQFFIKLINSPIDKIAVENPVGYVNSHYRKPDQIIRAWQFGHPYKKEACLWLKRLPKLEPTNIIQGPYKKFDFWSTKRNHRGRSLKSVTFQGIADAMADQWS